MIVIPAYGRDYKVTEDVQTDWDSGKDFLIDDITQVHDGRYVNKKDYPEGNVIVYYDNLTKMTKVQ